MRVEYSVFDPTGNITILVTTSVDVAAQPAVAARLMELEPTAEQVGFLSEEPGFDIALRMAGGEFCGNASMSAAVSKMCGDFRGRSHAESGAGTVKMRVSGAAEPVMADVRRVSDDTWQGTVDMPRPSAIKTIKLPGAGELPVVVFDGISHVICNCTISKEEAEAHVSEWCRYLGAEALGLMFLNEADSTLTPLVYVPAAGTIFWENSCASGTTACGAYLAAGNRGPCSESVLLPDGSDRESMQGPNRSFSVSLRQPGGSLMIEVRPDGGLCLSGTVRFCGHRSADFQ